MSEPDEVKGLTVEIGGVPVDLNAGMIQAVTNPPQGFVSKLSFSKTDIACRLNAIPWFVNCGKPLNVALTMPTQQVTDWEAAVASCQDPLWENVELEARNQLTLWLHLNDKPAYRKWNEIVVRHKAELVNPLTQRILVPFQESHGFDISFVHTVTWDILGALMEDSYLPSGHKAFFFLELLLVYEAGHFPCGWIGDWPNGVLQVF